MYQARIEMYGRLRAPEIPVYGTKTLGIREGTLELHGKYILNPQLSILSLMFNLTVPYQYLTLIVLKL